MMDYLQQLLTFLDNHCYHCTKESDWLYEETRSVESIDFFGNRILKVIVMKDKNT